jgi:tyrosine-protein kinase Etk/Wzc
MNSAVAAPAVRLDEPELDVRALASVLRRRFAVFMAILALIGGSAVGLSRSLPPIYQAATTVTPDKAPPVVLEGRTLSDLFTEAPSQIPDVFTVAELARSENVREGALTRLSSALGAEAATTALQAVEVQRVRDTEFVRITVEHASPAVAAAAANAVADSLMDLSRKTRRRRATELKQFLLGQLRDAESRLRTSERTVVEFKNRYGDVALAEETRLNLERLAQLEGKRVELALARGESQSLIATLQNQLATLEIELAGLQREFTSRHPAVISVTAKIAEARRRLEAAESQSRLIERERQQLLAGAIRAHEAQLRTIPAREADLANLTRRAKEAEEIYLVLSAKLQQVIIAEASIGSAIQVVDRAKVPGAPARSGSRKVVFFGSAFAVLLGVAVVFGLEQIDDRLAMPEDLERLTGALLLAGIPAHRRRRRRAAATWGEPENSPAGAAYRGLGIRIAAACLRGPRRAILITSALRGEGKTAVARNLAWVFARAGRKVWLVDGSLRSPLPNAPAAESAEGLSDVLRGEKGAEEVVRQSSHSHLWTVSRGTRPDPADLLNTERLAQFFAIARTRADIVVVDGPALLAAPETEVLGSHADCTVLVARMGKTSHRALGRVGRRLQEGSFSVAGSVITFAPPRLAGSP